MTASVGWEKADGPGWARAMAAALLGLLAVRIGALYFNATDLFFDEAQYWSWSRELDFGYYSKPPLIAWLIRLATETCGASEFCIRLPSPLIHAMTAGTVFALGRRLYDARCGFWAALTYATLPGVTASAGIISTDVPLLLSWAVALYAAVRLIEGDAWWPALLLGAALGAGLNAKYAMAYFVPCWVLFVALSAPHRRLAADPRPYAALGIALLMILPNLAWNMGNAFATFAHTADNANWRGSLVNPDRMAEFVVAQFGVFGPILFGVLLVVAYRALRRGAKGPDLLLLCFTLPILAVAIVQAFLSRAHANWAAPSYVAGAVLVTATLLSNGQGRRWLAASLALHMALLAAFVVGTTAAGRFAIPGAGDPFARMLGWRQLGEATAKVLQEHRAAGQPLAAVLTDDRQVTAELLYYLRQVDIPILAWREGERPRDHYELKRPFRRGSPEPVLLVTLRRTPPKLLEAFAAADLISEQEIALGATGSRRFRFYLLAGYKGD